MEIVSAPGWRYPGAPTLVQLNRGEGLLVRAAAPEQLRAENEYWKTYHREKQERLERFKVAVKERVARAAHLKREVRATPACFSHVELSVRNVVLYKVFFIWRTYKFILYIFLKMVLIFCLPRQRHRRLRRLMRSRRRPLTTVNTIRV